MGILNIVNRILRGLFHSQIQIKFKVRICFSGIKEKSCCINRNFIQQGYQCDCLSAPLGQLYDFAVPHQHYHLHQNNIQPVCICPHCSQGCFQAWYIAVVVSTQNINRTVKVSGHQLVIVVSDIRHNVSRDTVCTNQYKILICTEFRCLEPNCPILFISIAPLGQLFYYMLYAAIFVQGAFPKPVVIDNAILLQIPFQSGNVFRQSIANQCISPLLTVAIYIFVAIQIPKCFCMFDDVHALISIFRHRNRRVKQLQIPHFQ